MAGDIGAGDYEKERRARYQQCEAMNSLRHFRFAIADCRGGYDKLQFVAQSSSRPGSQKKTN
jgi:hypothetical protein